MADHKPRIEPNGDAYDARCSCRAIMLHPGTHEEADEWVQNHLELVNRVREHLSSRNPPLSSQRDYYLERASDPRETSANREIWQRLADELSTRLGESGAPSAPSPRLF